MINFVRRMSRLMDDWDQDLFKLLHTKVELLPTM